MKCPKCKGRTLATGKVKSGKLELDRCPSCKGIWFDDGKLKQLLGYKAEKNLSIPDYAVQKTKILCPDCSVPLYEFCYPGTMILVDACKSCNGIWLDDREWKEISSARDVKNLTICPECHTKQIKSDSCTKCGVVFAKLRANTRPKTKKEQKAELKETIEKESYTKDIPGLKGKLLRFIDGAIETLTDY